MDSSMSYTPGAFSCGPISIGKRLTTGSISGCHPQRRTTPLRVSRRRETLR